VKGEYWKAISKTPVKKGSKVKIIKVDGLTLIVEEMNIIK
jgi:membrane-bound ClpP family serine protease